MQDLLAGIMDIQEKILPLGTVVELNKEFIARKIPQVAIKKVAYQTINLGN